jgi:hypothetical protein
MEKETRGLGEAHTLPERHRRHPRSSIPADIRTPEINMDKAAAIADLQNPAIHMDKAAALADIRTPANNMDKAATRSRRNTMDKLERQRAVRDLGEAHTLPVRLRTSATTTSAETHRRPSRDLGETHTFPDRILFQSPRPSSRQ